MRWRRGRYTIDTDRGRLDMAAILGWLGGSYWASTRPPEAVRRSWEAADPVFGLYADEKMAGCARVVTDFVAVAYLADVFLVSEHRGAGLGLWLVETVVGHPDLTSVRWLLHTRDAHGLYRRVGFVQAGDAVMERPRTAQEA